MPRDREALEDIRLAIEQAISYAAEVTKRRFDTSSLHQDAVIRQLEVMGEAVKRLSEEVKALHPKIPWRKMANLRNLLIHEYDRVNIDEVWRVVRQELPKVLVQVKRLQQDREKRLM